MQKLILYLLGLLFIILGFAIESLGIIRLVIVIMGIFLIDIQATKNHPQRLGLLIILPLILIGSIYCLDMLLVINLKRIPVFSYEIKSGDQVSTHNSFFYRVYDCRHNLIMDYGYQQNYACDSADLATHDVNAFLGETLASFHEYQHKFVKISGKISKISGKDILELSPYKEDSKNTLNGYVLFNTEYRIRIKTNADLSNRRIYDDITVIGLVSKITNEDKATIIELIDSLLLPSTIYEKYDYEIIENKNDDVTSYVEKENIYLVGLANIYVHFDNSHIYELNYLITDKRLSINDLIKETPGEEIKDEEEKLVGSYYNLEKFNIVKCQNKKIIISSKKQKITARLCS